MSYEEFPLEFLSQEDLAEGDWRPCKTSGFFGDVKWESKIARGWCEEKPEPGSKLKFKDLMRNQDRGICILLKEFTGADLVLENRDAVVDLDARVEPLKNGCRGANTTTRFCSAISQVIALILRGVSRAATPVPAPAPAGIRLRVVPKLI